MDKEVDGSPKLDELVLGNVSETRESTVLSESGCPQDRLSKNQAQHILFFFFVIVVTG